MKEKILFCGDLVIPYNCKVNYEEVKPLFKGKMAIANLEGAILQDEKEVECNKWNDKFSLYSCPKILDVIHDLNICCVSLCNNHILDYQKPIQFTENLLSQHKILSFGLKNLDVVGLSLNGRKLYVITFATFANEHSLPLFNPKEVVNTVKKLRTEDKECLIAVFPHWGIEKLRVAEPADRQLAHQCIDVGADIVVGHHPHIIQDIEIYKGRHIIYSIGNFILPQTFYGNKKLVFKDPYIQNELVVEWDGSDIKFYNLYYDVSCNTLRLLDEFPLGALYERFSVDARGEILSQREYTKQFIQELSIKDIIFRSRFFATRWEEIRSYCMRRAFRMIRRTMITIGLHKPYQQ